MADSGVSRYKGNLGWTVRGAAPMRSSPRAEATRFIVVALAIVGISATGAVAVGPTDSLSGGEGWFGLSRADLDRMNTAAALLYEGPPGSTVERWTSTFSGKSGEVRLVGSFNFHGMPCRKLDYTVTSTDQPAPGHYVMNWCRVPDGTWKIVEVPQQR